MDSVFRPDLFAGKRVVVTGGSSGIGLGISEAFARHGAHVVIASRSEERLRAAAAQVQEAAQSTQLAGAAAGTAEGADSGTQTGGTEGTGGTEDRVSWHSVDVRDTARMEEVAHAVKEQGGADILVNAAAGNFPVPFSAMSDNAWRSVIDIVLNGTANATRAFGPQLQSRDGASIINIVAGYAWTGAPAVAHSGAAKAGVLNLTRSLAVEWGPRVRANAVSPGPIGETEGMKRLAEDLGLGDVVVQGTPAGRLGRIQEVADACLFLASPAASYITGACMVVDGGQDAMGPFGGLWQAMARGA